MRATDMERLWDEHTYNEFALRDVDATMVEQPYVINLPTLTGGSGQEGVRRFYAEQFLPNMPADIAVEPVSRTVGTNRVVDEMIVTMTHDCEVPWMLPGVAATGKRIELAVVGVIGFAEGLIAYEHLWWDQASVLVQLDLLPVAGLPVNGLEIADRLRSLSGLPVSR